MTLHEAIRDILINYGPLTVKEIAGKIYETGIYRRRDLEYVNPVQISARIHKYPELFKIEETGTVVLKQYALASLKRSIEKIADTLRESKMNADGLKEVLLPTFAIFLRYSDPGELIGRWEPLNNDVVDVINQQLIWFNTESKFHGLFEKPLKVFGSLERNIQSRLAYQLMVTYGQFTEVKPVLFNDFLNFDTDDYKPDEEKVNAFKIRHQEYQQWVIADYDFEVYFNSLINEFLWKRKIGQARSTPASVINLIRHLVKIKPGSTVFDPFMGNGSLLCALVSDSTSENIVGGDINENSVMIAKLLFSLHGISNQNLREANALVQWSRPDLQFDCVITDPPSGGKFLKEQTVFAGYGQSKNFTEAAINISLYHTHQQGKACIIIPEQFLFAQSKSSYEIRKKILNHNYLEAIITLPAGVFAPYSNLKAAILILDKGRNERAQTDVFFYDGTSILAKELEKHIPAIHDSYDEFRTQDLYQTPNAIDSQILIDADFNFDIASILYEKEERFNHPEYCDLGDLLRSKAISRTYKPFNFYDETSFTEITHQNYYPGNSIDKVFINSSVGIPYISISTLREQKNNLFIDESNIKQFVSDTDFVRPRYIENGALLVSQTGDSLLPAVYRGKIRALFNRNILCLNVDERKVLAEFLVVELNKDYIREQLNRVVRKGVVLQKMSVGSLLKLRVWVPSMDQQKKIVEEFIASFINNQINKDELSTVLGALKHNVKGPLGGIRAFLDRLHFYLLEKEKSGTAVSLQDLAYHLMPGQAKENYTQYSLSESIKRTKYHISRIDNYFKKAVKLLVISDEKVPNEQIKLAELVEGYLKADNDYHLNVVNSTNPKFKNIVIQSNKDCLLSILELFLDNAFVHGFRSAPDGDSRFEISWEVTKAKESNSKVISFSVGNNGLPAPNLTLEKFIRNGYSTNKTGGGTGVGGFYIEKLLGSIGGNMISVEDLSEKPEQNNIRFTFNLPYYD